MKPLLISFLFFPFLAFNQKAVVKEIRLYANPKYFNPKEKYATIIIPVVVTKNPIVSKMINDKIREEGLSLEKNQNIRSGLKDQIDEGLTDVSYDVTYNQNYFLSLNIYVEGSGGNHISFYTTYFNFDLRNGSEIALSDIIKKEKIDSFRKKIFQDRKDSLDKYKEEEYGLIKDKVIDSLDYQWITGKLEEENTMSEGFGETFSLSDREIEIIEPIEFPSAMRSQDPSFQLRYRFDSIRSILNSKFLNAIKK